MGWYIGPSHDWYWCYKCYVPATRGTRDPNTVSFYPHDFATPALPEENEVERALKDLTAALTHAYTKVPLPPVGYEQFQAIRQLEKIFSAAPSLDLPIPTPATLLSTPIQTDVPDNQPVPFRCVTPTQDLDPIAVPAPFCPFVTPRPVTHQLRLAQSHHYP